jgi:RNA recognition motif-containing protein
MMKLFIGNLPYNISEPELLELFTDFGEVVNANLVKDPYTGQSRGFAFIEMDSLNKQVYKSRELVCNEAKPKKKSGRRR